MSHSISLPKSYFVALFCEAIFQGMYTILFGAALYLLHRRRAARETMTNRIMIAMTVIMYSLSIAYMGISLSQNLIGFFEQDAARGGLTILNDQGSPLVYSQIAIEIVNCLLGDSIVIWRAWVLWERNWKIIYLPCALILAGGASGGVLVHAFSLSPSGQEVYSDTIIRWFAIFAGLTFTTNFYAVCAISYRIWVHHRQMTHLGEAVVISGGKYFSALFLLIESGAIYCVALVTVMILFALSDNGVYIMTDILAHLTGMYSTVIIVLVCMKLTQHDDITRREAILTTMRFGTRPDTYRTGPSPGTSTSAVMRPIRIYVSDSPAEDEIEPTESQHREGNRGRDKDLHGQTGVEHMHLSQ